MSTDPIGAALTRDHPAVSVGAPQIAPEQPSELTGIATAIERVEALLASVGPEPEGSDAVERIADIAFVLHERDVEASLCDALDAAVRELSNADAAKQTNVQHVRQAAELLRELSQRVSDMIALLQVSPPPSDANDPAAKDVTPEQGEPALAEQPLSADALDGDIPREGLFTAETLEDDEFARAVAELAASLPALAEPVEAVSVALHESVDPTTNELTLAVIEAQPIDLVASEPSSAPEPPEALFETRQPAELVAETPGPDETAANTLAGAQHDLAELAVDKSSLEQQPLAMRDTPVTGQTLAEELSIADAIEEPVACEHEISTPHPPAEASEHDAIPDAVPAGESAVSETLSEEAFSGGEDAPAQPMDLPGDSSEGETALAPDNSPVAAVNAEPDPSPSSAAPPPSAVTNSLQALLPELALVDPQDDPGDLFEPLTGAAPPIAAATLTAPQSASEIPPRVGATRGRSPAAADPLTALRTRGAEELLALLA